MESVVLLCPEESKFVFSWPSIHFSIFLPPSSYLSSSVFDRSLRHGSRGHGTWAGESLGCYQCEVVPCPRENWWRQSPA